MEGRREGFGEYTMVDGSIYSGGWSHNSPFGDGKLIIPKQGEWREREGSIEKKKEREREKEKV